jgi:hypothetical protein
MGSLNVPDGAQQPEAPKLIVRTQSLPLERDYHRRQHEANTSPTILQLNHAASTWSDGRVSYHAKSPADEIYRQLDRHGPELGVFTETTNNLRRWKAVGQAMNTGTVKNTEMDKMDPNKGNVFDNLPASTPAVETRVHQGVVSPGSETSTSEIDPIEQSSEDDRRSIEPMTSEEEEPLSPIALPPPGPPPGPGPGPQVKVFVTVNQPQKLLHRPQAQDASAQDKQWARIKSLRVEIWGLRSRMHEQRTTLREKRQAASVADNRYFQYVRARDLGMTYGNQDISKQQKTVAELFQECEALRDECGPLEDELLRLEDHVGNRELELQRLEELFYQQSDEPPGGRTPDAAPSPHSRNPSNYSESELSQQLHPMVSEYLSKIGDIEILEERYDWHEEEKSTLEQEKATRQRVNLLLAERDQEWLDNYPNTIDLLLKQLEEAKEEARQMRAQCYARGLVDEEGNPTDFETQERQNFIEDVDAGSETSEYVKFPLLMHNPATQRIELKDSCLNLTEDPVEDAENRVDQWLFHQLRSSALDVNLLARIYQSMYGTIDGEKWQHDVIAFWFKNPSVEKSSLRRISSSVMAIEAPRKGFVSYHSPDERGNHSSAIFVRSSRLSSGKSAAGSTATRKRYRLFLSAPPNNTITKSV